MMKQLLIPVILVLLVACQPDFDPAADGKAIPVVYCLLDLNDSIQELRLGKSIPNLNKARHDANISLTPWDESTEIYIEENPGESDSRIYYFSLTNDAFVQDSGLFLNPSFQLFESQFKPKPETTYSLYVFLNESEVHCFATIQTIGISHIADPAQIPGRQISFSPYDDYSVHFYPSTNSGYHECYFQFGDWIFGRDVYRQEQEEGTFVELSSERFFTEVPLGLDLESPTFHLNSYGHEMALYNQIQSSSTSPMGRPDYTPFINGVGLFSSVHHQRVSNLSVSDVTLKLIDQGYLFETDASKRADSISHLGTFAMTFSLPNSQLPLEKVHRFDLSLAYSVDSLYKGLFFASANVTDSQEEYQFFLKPGSYYYQVGITCSCLADSCLWDGYPDGQFGRKYATNRFSISKGNTTTESPTFQ